jgi:Fe-S-cluster containining protein
MIKVLLGRLTEAPLTMRGGASPKVRRSIPFARITDGRRRDFMSLCTLCARLGKTCCQDTDVILTLGDIERIRTHAGRTDFFEHRLPRDAGCLGGEDDPRWLLYTVHPDGSRTVVCHSRDGDCVFLTSEGCSLPCEVRPLICRLHPFAYTESGIEGTSDGCPEGLLGGEDLLQSIGMDRESATRWHRQLYAELKSDLRQGLLEPQPIGGKSDVPWTAVGAGQALSAAVGEAGHPPEDLTPVSPAR